MKDFIDLGKKIYDIKKGRELRRMIVFVVRSWYYGAEMQELSDFFHRTPLLTEVAGIYPFVYEQPQRAFFYNKSTMRERINIVIGHMDFMAKHFKDSSFKDIYREEKQQLWEMAVGETPLRLFLYFEPGQRKEGMLSVMLNFGTKHLYQIIFWIDPEGPDGPSMWIGAMQGPNMENSKEIIKQITKACHTFRTKNLILYAAQAVARALDLKHIYAVTNYGYYANNHIRTDRKLKTNFSDFWKEAGGHATSDSRFDELPLTEARKTMEEVPTRKRAVYRRRFALMDEIDGAVAQNMKKLFK